MTLREIANALRTYVTTLVGPSLDFEGFVGFDNALETEGKVIAVGKVYGALNILWGENSKIEAGRTANHRQRGIMQLTFTGKPDEGDSAVLAVAEYYLGLCTSRTTGGVVLETPSPENLGIVNGWYTVVVSCPFEADTVVTV